MSRSQGQQRNDSDDKDANDTVIRQQRQAVVCFCFQQRVGNTFTGEQEGCGSGKGALNLGEVQSEFSCSPDTPR